MLPGAFLSATGATLGSSLSFALSRGQLKQRVDGALAKQPVARGLAKVVEEDGFRTVFVLRLAPILPLPLASYPYIYGTSNVSYAPFAAGTFLGSLKPYLLDAYLGVFSKQLIDGDALDTSKDAILLFGLGVLVLVGVFASELAAESWEKVQAEVAAEKETRGAEAEEGATGSTDEAAGPLSSTRAWLAARLPDETRGEAAEVWAALGGFADFHAGGACRRLPFRRTEP